MQRSILMWMAGATLCGWSARASNEELAAVVEIPAGAFLMGSDTGAADEAPVHRVELSAYAIDRYEVTNARYRACAEAGACRPPVLRNSHQRRDYYGDPAFDDFPVIFVSWHEAAAFCRFAGGRLPTEAEWEKAARGPEPDLRAYPWGDAPPTCALVNMKGCVDDTDRVGSRPLGASPFGVLDLAGNVWEWTADWYDAVYYASGSAADPTGAAVGSLKVMRGGCWVSGASNLRVSCRKAQLPDAWADNVGLRCVYPGGR